MEWARGAPHGRQPIDTAVPLGERDPKKGCPQKFGKFT